MAHTLLHFHWLSLQPELKQGIDLGYQQYGSKDPTTRDSRREQNQSTVITWDMKQEEQTAPCSNPTSTTPPSGKPQPLVWMPKVAQKQLQPRIDTTNVYINLNKCMMPTHMLSWQPAVPFACCYRHSEINVTAQDKLISNFYYKAYTFGWWWARAKPLSK